MKPTYDNGLGSNARSEWQVTNGPHNGDNKLSGFYVGQVMDDRDDQYMGRVWVYIPEVSVTRWDANSLPQGGTSPDRKSNSRGVYDQNMRNGWILISPMSPLAGADDYRNASRPDGTSSIHGAINSYGMTSQARIGDFVGIMFSAGDPNSGYYIGMIPKHNRNGMVPGVPGTTPAADMSTVKNAELATQVHPAAKVPTLDSIATSKDVKSEKKVAASDLFRNMARAGVSADPARGAGNSGSRRESPSYVTGIKTTGWSYDSEKNNRDTDGKPFSNRVKELSGVNTTGHQFIMDDHPDNQQIRFRTSSGAQILMYDSGTDPFIYIQTATGGTWVELSDSGNVSIYAQGDINLHAQGDYNLTTDGDMNVDVKGNYNLNIGGTKNEDVAGLVQTIYASSHLISVEEDLDFNVSGNTRINYSQDADISIGGNETCGVIGRSVTTVSGEIKIQSRSNYEMAITGDMIHVIGGNQEVSVGGVHKTHGESLEIQADAGISFKSGGAFNIDAGAKASIKAGDIIALDGTYTYIQSGKSDVVNTNTISPIHGAFYAADKASLPIMPASFLTPAAPTHSEIISTTTPQFQESGAKVVPQHQPWIHRAGASSTSGTNGLVTKQPILGVASRRSQNIACSRNKTASQNTITNIIDLMRTGANFTNALIPDSLMGIFDSVVGFVPAFFTGLPFSTSNKGEAPSYNSPRLTKLGDTAIPSLADFSASSKSLAMSLIKQFHPPSQTPQLDALMKNFHIGFGIDLNEARKVFSGLSFTDEIISKINSISNDFQKTVIVPVGDAIKSLETSYDTLSTWINDNVQNVEISPRQHAALISFLHNVGIDNIVKDIEFMNALSKGDMLSVSNEMKKYVFVGENINCGLVERRRIESGYFGQYPSKQRYKSTGSSGNYTLSGNTITVSGFHIPVEVHDALQRAKYILAGDVPVEYLYVVVAYESSFNPNAYNASSAAGLFQFVSGTGRDYGLSTSRAPDSDVFDPYKNARAGALFTMDNYRALKSYGITTVHPADLYFAHLLGLGGARSFFKGYLATPNSPVAASGNLKHSFITSNPNVFYKNYKLGVLRTYAETYAHITRVMDGRLSLFSGLAASGITYNDGSIVSGGITWRPAKERPSFTATGDAIATANLAIVRSKVEQSASTAGISKLGFNQGYVSKDVSEANGGSRDNTASKGQSIVVSISHLTDAERQAFLTALINNGITGLGVGENEIHADIRSGSKVVWPLQGGFSWGQSILQSNGFKGA